MVKCCRKTIGLSDLWVTSNEKLSDFYLSSWQRGDSVAPMLTLRIVLAMVAVAILLWSVIEAPRVHWLLYLTNWGMVLVSAALVFGLFVSCKIARAKPPDSGDDLPWYVSVYWLLFNLGVTVAFTITALYWILLYSPDLKQEAGMRFFYLEVATHGMNSCLIFVELFASRTPVRILHVYQPLGFGLWYAVFTYIYYLLGGTDINGFPFIYDILDWHHFKRTMVVVLITAIGLVLIYMMVYGMAAFRDKISTSFVRSTTTQMRNVPKDYIVEP